MTRQRESDGYLPRELDYDTGLSNEERDPAEEDLEKDPRRRMALLDRSTACVFMAAVNARATGRTAAEYEDEVTKDIPLRRLARPEEIADGIVWLASERASYVNGQTILLVGGLYRGL
jgi:NAD(P)-dependent dehydrogenase (short-subunit alcohol dehydrogenase family)